MNLKKVRTLIVEDDKETLEYLKKLVRQHNQLELVAEASDKCMALQKFRLAQPDLVLLDIMMPNVDGYQTLKKIKENEQMQHTKVVFLSAKNKHSDIQKGLDMGADKYLTKPFTVKKIIEEVKEII